MPNDSGIVHVLILDEICIWSTAPETLYKRSHRRAAKGVWASLFCAPGDGQRSAFRVALNSCGLVPPGEKGGAKQAIWRWRGGRTTKIDDLTDLDRRPNAFLLTGKQVPKCVADTLLDEIGTIEPVHDHKDKTSTPCASI